MWPCPGASSYVRDSIWRPVCQIAKLCASWDGWKKRSFHNAGPEQRHGPNDGMPLVAAGYFSVHRNAGSSTDRSAGRAKWPGAIIIVCTCCAVTFGDRRCWGPHCAALPLDAHLQKKGKGGGRYFFVVFVDGHCMVGVFSLARMFTSRS